MEVDEGKVLKVLNTVKELKRVANENVSIVDEIVKELHTNVLSLKDLREIWLTAKVRISKYPTGTLVDNDIKLVDCIECELVFDGVAITVYGRPPDLSNKQQLMFFNLRNINLKDLLMLYYIEVGNEGCLDALVNEVVKQSEKLASWLETIKKVLALVKVALT